MGCDNIENYNSSIEPRDLDDMRGEYDTAVIVLQEGSIEEGYEGSKISYHARMRMQAAMIAYLESRMRGEKPVIILSGGVPNPVDDEYTEASYMKHMLVTQCGFPEEDIVVEDKSHDTSTNAIYTREILSRLGFEEQGKVQLITNGYHLPRSKMLFEKYWGPSFDAIDAEEFLSHNRSDRYMLPGDRMPHPYGLFAKHYREMPKTKLLNFIDGVVLKTISKYPAGELLLRNMAKSRLKKS